MWRPQAPIAVLDGGTTVAVRIGWMRSTPLNALAVAAACFVACDDATLQEPRAPEPKDHANPSDLPLGPDCVGCTREQFGFPSWLPARVVLFSGNVGPAGEYRDSLLQSLLAPRHQFAPKQQAHLSVDPHPPPYDDEIYDLLDARGITPSQVFEDAQFTAPEAVVMAMTVVASENAHPGPSTDFETGLAISPPEMPIAIDGDLYRDGKLFDPAHDRQAIAPNPDGAALPPYSHFFLGFAGNSALAKAPRVPPDGYYEYRITMVGATGGWFVRVPFKVGKGGNGDVPSTSGAGGSVGPGAGGSAGGGAAGAGGTATGLGGSPVPGGPGGSAAGGGPGIIVPLVPDANGAFDGNNAAGVRGAWWAGGDFYGLDGSEGGGSCSLAGFVPGDCSMINTPPPGQPITPVNGAICTGGVVAQVISGSDGQPAWSSIWGTSLGFDLAVDDAGVAGPYDAPAHKFRGFAFDIEGPTPPGGPWMRVEFATVGTDDGAAYWQGAVSDTSPVLRSGHYEIRWQEVGGPFYMGASAPPFDSTRLTSIRFHVVPNMIMPIPYGFCIRNTAFLMN